MQFIAENPGLMDELMDEVLTQMRNEEGPDFQALKDLPGLLLVDEADKSGLDRALGVMIARGI
jgi:hypothetical protein